MRFAIVQADKVQKFPSRTEGSVKKHWYKVPTLSNSFAICSQYLRVLTDSVRICTMPSLLKMKYDLHSTINPLLCTEP
jgi:hypothetical protein